MRDVYVDIVRTAYPWYEVRSDFELLALGGRGYDYAEGEGLGARLEQDWSAFVSQFEGDADNAMWEVRRTLDTLVEVTGVSRHDLYEASSLFLSNVIQEKPMPGDANVTIIPIPESPYSLRMWPGAASTREFCLDYVYAKDPKASVNKPPGYKLTIHVPGGATPWLGVGRQPLHSLEASFGIRDEDIIPGEERFVVLEGMVCSLEYPEQDIGGPVSFEVPVRASQ